MRKQHKTLSTGLVLALMTSFLMASPASAAQEVRVDISRGSYMTITNVVEEIPAFVRVYTAEAPVTVTFHGEDLCLESIEYYTQGEVIDYEVSLDGFAGYVPFAVKHYTYFGETEVHDALVESPEDLVIYLSGNYATLTEPGYYVVTAAPEAAVGTEIVIQIGSQAAAEPTVTPEPAVVSAVPTPSKVLVNGQEVSFAAYLINGNNYFKLRDLAMVLSGTEKQFEVTWDAEQNAIHLVTGLPYTPVGGELAVPGDLAAQEAVPTPSKVYLNGQEVQFTAYKIGGNNYFKLRDIGMAVDFGVTWNADTNTVGIDSTTSYTE